MMTRNPRPHSLYWQSQLLLLIVVPACFVRVLMELMDTWQRHDVVFLEAIGFSITFGLVVWLARAGTGPAVVTGSLITACLYLRTPGLHTALFPLVATLVLALVATRIGRSRKEQVGIAESRQGRNASQVAANLGVAALASIPFTMDQIFSPNEHNARVALAAIAASLAETTADTLSSEFGQVFGGAPRLVTTMRPVPVGTDGGITFSGSVAGALGAALVTVVAAVSLRIDPHRSTTIFACSILGLFIDSLLGATLERRGWLHNDAVNFLSSMTAALAAGWLTP